MTYPLIPIPRVTCRFAVINANLFAVVIAATLLLPVGCGGGGSEGTSPPTSPPISPNATVGSVTVNPSTTTIVAGSSAVLSAAAVSTTGVAMTSTFSWTSSNAAIATVTPAGVVTAISPGQSTITASAQSKFGTAEVTVIGKPAVFASLSAGDSFTCGRRTNGAVYCWGHGGQGQLGDGNFSSDPRSVPKPISAAFAFSMVASGVSHSCGTATNGFLYCWGNGTYQQNGLGYPALVPTPVTVLTYAKISAGYTHSCAIATTGTTYCWGTGYLGNGVFSNGQRAAVTVSGGLAFTSITTGGGSSGSGVFSHTCALTSDGVAYCWGSNFEGRLGIGDPNVHVAAARTTPTLVSGNLRFTNIAAGAHHTCGLTNTGTAYCWGRNSSGQLGNGSMANSIIPVQVTATGISFSSIATGDDFTCAVSTPGTLYCWGMNNFRQLGDGTTTTRTVPTTVSGTVMFSRVVAGDLHACGLSIANEAYCWGDNRSGELGDGTTAARTGLTPVSGEPSLATSSVAKQRSN